MRRAGLLLAALSASAPAQQKSPQAMPAWLVGGWEMRSADGKWSEEWWTPPRAGLMLGGGRSGQGAKLDWWELTRIEQTPSGIMFCALPKGQAGACFNATRVSARAIVFENSKHDFPTRVAYRREGDRLFAEISGPGGANPRRWTFSRIP